MNLFDPSPGVTGGQSLAQAIVDTIREPLLVLDREMRVVAASRSFYDTFRLTVSDVQGHFLYLIADGQWDIPELRVLLERVLPEEAGMEGFELSRDFAGLGRRNMLLNARTVFYEDNAHKMILLAMEDVTAWRSAEAAMAKLLRDKEILLQEMQHRVANSLQIIASILLLKARAVQSEETRRHLRDAHHRVMSVAAVQEQLRASRHGETVQLGPYFARLSETLAASMIGENRRISVTVDAPQGEAQSNDAVSLGLLVTELMLNAIKHAFPDPAFVGAIHVEYRTAGEAWSLAVTDNGVGTRPGPNGEIIVGLGASIIEAIAAKLDAVVEKTTGPAGTSVTIRHAPVKGLLDAAE